ncbi:MAG: hypothetical protein OXU26_04025 [Acidobacteriota bacterium]|nr:hypothetical protein [Acidobacteriota bacterium]
MFVTCPKCNRGLTVKELVTDSHQCSPEKPSNQTTRSTRIPRNPKYIKDNFDSLVAAALKNS